MMMMMMMMMTITSRATDALCFIAALAPCLQGLTCFETQPDGPCASPPCPPLLPNCGPPGGSFGGCSSIQCEFGAFCNQCEFGALCISSTCICDPTIVPGDANNDGLVQVNDIVALIGGVLDPASVSSCIFPVIDANTDGVLTVGDVVLTVESIVG